MNRRRVASLTYWLVAAVLFWVLWYGTHSAHAEQLEIPVPPPGHSLCDPVRGICILRLEEFVASRKALAEMDTELAKLKSEAPKCGTLEVVPKDKPASPPAPKKPASSLPPGSGPRRNT